VNKPAGMVGIQLMPIIPNTCNALLHHVNKLSNLNAPGRPGIVHRIDKDTSGLLVVAKDEWTHAKLAAQFARHNIEREYQAVVWGKLKEKEGEIDTFIHAAKKDRKNSQQAKMKENMQLLFIK